jgi:hypothetical protein
MVREYMVGDQLVGKDVPSTAAPQVGLDESLEPALCPNTVSAFL